MEDRIEYLLRQYEKNNCSREELEELFSYINKLRNNDQPLKKMVKHIYEDIKKNHPSFTYVDEEGKLILTEPEDTHFSSERISLSKGARGKLLAVVIISCIVGLVSLGWLIKTNLSSDSFLKRHINGALIKKFSNRAEQAFIPLSDSSMVWLNAASALQYSDHFSDDEKEEVILSGEGLFKVNDSRSGPFLIRSDKVVITVLPGTKVDVKNYPDERSMVLYVAEGMVKVSRDKKLLPTVAAGHMLAINKADGQLTQGKADIQTIAAWQQGNMYYRDMHFIDIIRDMQRVYNIDITLTRNELEQKKITAFFPRDIGPRAALDTICAITNSQLDADGSRRFIIL